MLEDRGYIIPEQEAKAISTGRRFIKYLDEMEGNLDMIYEREEDGDVLSVVYNLETKGTKKKQLEDLMSRVKQQYDKGEVENFIIITILPLNEGWLKKLKPSVQVFIYDELAINPTRHSLTPDHILLSDAERTELYRSPKMPQPHLMPGISVNDPVVKYYGGNVGDLFKIVRPTILDYYIGEFVFYREVRDIPLVGAISTDINGGEEAEGEEEEGEEFEY